MKLNLSKGLFRIWTVVSMTIFFSAFFANSTMKNLIAYLKNKTLYNNAIDAIPFPKEMYDFHSAIQAGLSSAEFISYISKDEELFAFVTDADALEVQINKAIQINQHVNQNWAFIEGTLNALLLPFLVLLGWISLSAIFRWVMSGFRNN